MTAKHKILLVVDNKELGDLIKKSVANKSYSFSTPKDEVLKSVFDEVPHLIIIDEDYAESQGRRTALEIKEDAVLKYIPIILLGRQDMPLPKDRNTIDFYVKRSQIAEKLLERVHDALSRNHNELDLNPLTHLPGTRSSVLRIERAIQSKKPFAVCCIDLSDLSAFNSVYGVSRGDDIIIRLSEIMKSVIHREGTKDDFIGHLGGDDLLVVTTPDQAVGISEAIIQSFDAIIGGFYDPEDRERGYIVQRNKEGELKHYPIMGVSLAIVHNDHIPLSEMVQISQIAGQLKNYMKGLPGSCYIKYRRSHKKSSKDEASVEVRFPSKMKSVRVWSSSAADGKYAEFFDAIIAQKKITSLYQPIVDLRSKRVVGYEALTRGLSNSFFDDAELLFSVARESGRVKELDKLCVEFALKNAQNLGADKKLFLNINHETLIDPSTMKDIFAEKGVIGFKNIVIEITEQSLLRSFDKAREALAELKDQGVSVAIDDVGGGAVSLRDVAVLKPDYIKFDRSLVRQIDINSTKQQIVLSLKLFANGIHAIAMAEGIETKEEYDAVLACGIHLGQGFYMARPGKPFPEVLI